MGSGPPPGSTRGRWHEVGRPRTWERASVPSVQCAREVCEGTTVTRAVVGESERAAEAGQQFRASVRTGMRYASECARGKALVAAAGWAPTESLTTLSACVQSAAFGSPRCHSSLLMTCAGVYHTYHTLMYSYPCVGCGVCPAGPGPQAPAGPSHSPSQCVPHSSVPSFRTSACPSPSPCP